MSFIQNLYTSRDNNNDGATNVGQKDRLWWDPVTNAFYYSDGETPGGIPVGGGGGGTPSGPNQSIQFNNGNTFAGSANLTFDSANSNVSVVGNVTATAYYGDGSHLTGVSSGLVLMTSNITSVVAGQSLNIEAIYGNTQYPGGIFRLYQAPAPRPTITMTDVWSATSSASKNAYTDYANNIVNTSNVSVTLGISGGTFSILSSDSITIGDSVITGTDLTGLGISGSGGTYTIRSNLLTANTQITATSAVSANLSTSAGNGITSTGTTLTTVAPVPFALTGVTANWYDSEITPGLGNDQPAIYTVTVTSGTPLVGNIILTGPTTVYSNVGNALTGNTANVDSTAGNYVVTASYTGTGLFGAGNITSNVTVNLTRAVETTPLFYKTTLTDANPDFGPTDANYANNWVPAPGAPGNTYGITTNQFLPDTAYYWLAIPDSAFWGYSGNSPSGLYYNYTLTGIGTVNSSFNAAYGNGTADFGGSGGNVVIGTVPYVVLGFTGFANAVTGPSNPPNVFVYVSTSPTS